MSFTDPPTSDNISSGNVTSRGIDFNAALDILSQRLASHTTKGHPRHLDSDDGNLPNDVLNGSATIRGCGCCVANNLDDTFVSLMDAETNFPDRCFDVGSMADGDDEFRSVKEKKHDVATDSQESTELTSLRKKQKEQSDAQQQALERQQKLASKLQSMTIQEMIATVFQAQEGRVQTYRFYDEALEHILSTGNVEYYPPVCANVTATFSVLSSTINAIRSNLESRDQQPSINEILALLTRLQRAEQSKLHLTAALHLERMRCTAERQMQQLKLDSDNSDFGRVGRFNNASFENGATQQGTVSVLLDESILLLRQKIALAIGEVIEVLEELRYSIPEDDED